jgi:hypothetical protein
MKLLTKVSKALRTPLVKRSAAVFVLGFVVWLTTELFAPPWLRAEIPVIDTAAIGQMIQQYTQMARQLVVLYNQVDILKQQVQSVTGHYGMGGLGRPINPWNGSSWAAISDMVNNGINPGDAEAVRAYQAARTRYQNQYPVLSDGLRTSNPRMNATYNQTYSDAVTGMGMGEASFNEVNTTLADVQTLKDRIEQTDNVKSAMDLNAAISVRVAQINGEILRTQAAQLRLQAADKNGAANGYAAQAEFFAQ